MEVELDLSGARPRLVLRGVDLAVKSAGTLSLEGDTVAVKATGDLTLQGGVSATLEATANVKVQSALIELN